MVANTPARLNSDSVFGILSPTCLTKRLATTLRGRLQFARTQVFSECGSGCRRTEPDTDGVIRAVACPACLGQDVARLQHSPGHFSLYTDGACAGISKASVGAVFVNETGQMCRHFGSDVPSAVLESLGLRWQRQVVGQAELLPVLIAKMAWREDLVGRPVLTFIDNDSARHSLIAGYSPSIASFCIIAGSSAMDRGLMIYQWIARVPSESNPRGIFDEILARGSCATEVPLDGTTGNVSWALILRALEV